MDKETKQLNTFLIAMVAISGIAAYLTPSYETRTKAVELAVDQMEVTPKIYSLIYDMALACDIKPQLREALRDERISYSEALDIGEICEARAVEQADQPFQRGLLEQELKYLKEGGVSM